MEAFNAQQQPYPDMMGAVVQGAQAGQTVRGISALRGIDMNDPDSINKGIAGLVRAGAADQASALMGLQITRGLYSGLPAFMAQATGTGGQTQGAPQGPQPAQAPAPGAQVAAMHQEMAQDATAYSQAAPDARPAMAKALTDKWVAKGADPGEVTSALQQASTPEGAAALTAHYGALAQAATQGNTDGVDQNALIPPQMAQAAQSAPGAGGDASNAYSWAKNYLDHPQWSMYEAMLKSKAGVDLGLTARAQAIMGPEFSEEAQVRNAQAKATETGKGTSQFDLADVQLPDGSHMQVPKSMALGLGAAGALHGPTPQALAQQQAAGGEAGHTPANLVTVNMPDGSTQQGTFAPGADGKYVFAPVNGGGAGGGQTVGRTPSIGSASDLKGQADNLNTESAEAKARLVSAPQNIAKGQALIGLANSIGTAKYTDALSSAAQLLPVTHSVQQYAANSSLLSQDLKGTFQQALNGMAVPRVAVEARSILGGIPTASSPQDQVKVYAAGLLAASQYNQAHDQFLVNWAANQGKPRNLAQAEAAWQAGPGKASLFAQPAWQGITVGGKPAVVEHQYKGQNWLIVLPGLLGKNAQAVRAP